MRAVFDAIFDVDFRKAFIRRFCNQRMIEVVTPFRPKGTKWRKNQP
jgi:hypothetical protein